MAEQTDIKLKTTAINTLVNAKTGKQIATLTKGGRSEKELTAIARRFVNSWNALSDFSSEFLEEIAKDKSKLLLTEKAYHENITEQRDALLAACEFAAEPEAPFSTDQLEFANKIIEAIEDKAKQAIALVNKE